MDQLAKSAAKTAGEARIAELVRDRPELAARLARVTSFARTVRVSEYHLTNACNIRCKGCWFFVNEFDEWTKDNRDPDKLKAFLARERGRGVNTALIIGGEPTLFPERIATYVEAMTHVTISSNGLKRLPKEGFENVSVFLSLFGGGSLDDELRAYKPSGARFTGIFDTTLRNYRNDPRACFLFAVTELGIGHIEDTVRRIRDNGNLVTYNFYSHYDSADPLRQENAPRLIDELLRVRDLYPQAVLSTPYYSRAIVTGESHWGSFGYETCPSISFDHPAHEERRKNGNRTLPLFRTYAPDLETVNFCCTSGNCADCRDSQAVNSWLMVSLDKFLDSAAHLEDWIGLAEAYWDQFSWYPHRRSLPRVVSPERRSARRLPMAPEFPPGDSI